MSPLPRQSEENDDWALTLDLDAPSDTVPQGRVQLLPGERLPLDSVGSGLAHLDSEDPIRRGQSDFRIVTEQARYQVAQIPDLVASDEWNLNPDFQRRHRWDNAKRSRLIESIMLNVPIPPIFLYEAELSRFEVMDGLQRLTAISEFYRDTFVLEGLEYFPDLNGKSFSALDEVDRRGIGRRYLSAVILLHETGKSPEEANLLKQLVFERINSGGIDLTPQESRNALLPGAMNTLCLLLAENPNFRRLWGIAPSEEAIAEGVLYPTTPEKSPLYRSMYDVELVLRFFAYRQRLAGISGRPRNLRGFLDAYLQAANHYKKDLLSDLRSLFENTAQLVEQVLGYRAFWLFRQRRGVWQWIEEPAVVAYEPIMLAFSQRLDRAEDLVFKRNEIRGALEEFYKSFGDKIDGRKVNTKDLEARNSLYLEFLDSILGN
ncbi:DUF262 domain-containing protein [Kitasatospora cineracea]|uniref:Uncharacterized protein DUF262 n=1 Tax=Kitasatospora cineracea TaxID=88074 RepID=A0A3N4RHJ2_9ACTN|nr:DUF262 domain-containing protein [Kitasatospora cineracea]RPE32888.1 uncharacterized protein DUF262 [Kitasatospora cineracea]